MKNIAHSSEEIALDFLRIELKKEFPEFSFVVTPPKQGDEDFRLVCMELDEIEEWNSLEIQMIGFARGYNAAMKLIRDY